MVKKTEKARFFPMDKSPKTSKSRFWGVMEFLHINSSKQTVLVGLIDARDWRAFPDYSFYFFFENEMFLEKKIHFLKKKTFLILKAILFLHFLKL